MTATQLRSRSASHRLQPMTIRTEALRGHSRRSTRRMFLTWSALAIAPIAGACDSTGPAPPDPIVGVYEAVQVDSSLLPAPIARPNGTRVLLISAWFTAARDGTYSLQATEKLLPPAPGVVEVVVQKGKYLRQGSDYLLADSAGAGAGIASVPDPILLVMLGGVSYQFARRP